jgi:dipeptidyl-peptidase-4
MSTEDSFPRLQARTHRFTLGTPRGFRVSPDGQRVLFLRSASGTDSRHGLYVLDVPTGRERCLVDPTADEAENPPEQERARRERSRTQGGGVLAFACDTGCSLASVALSGRLYVVDVAAAALRELPALGPVIDPRPSPTGEHVAYVSGGALHVVGLADGTDRVVAEPEAGADVAWGAAEFVAAEEMGRQRGYWWSPDGDRLLLARVDTGDVPVRHITDPAEPTLAPRRVAYPAAGTSNAVVALWLAWLDGTKQRVAWSGERFPYLARVHWSEYGRPLLAVQSREQTELRILAVDVETGRTEALVTEHDPHWVDLFDGVPAWSSAGELVRIAPSGGVNRLFVGQADVSGPELTVRSVLDAGADVLFTASGADPTQVHVYRSSAGGPVRVSAAEGVHSAARGGDTMLLSSLGLGHDGPRVSLPGRVANIAAHTVSPPLRPAVRLLELGPRRLRAALLLPRGHEPGSGKLPVLMSPYGGPHAQRVLRARTGYLTAQWWADQGFAVLIVDGRGTPGRGPGWEREIAGALADVTLADQVEGLRVAAGDIADLDTSRVGIHGWSYGGYLAALAVLREPEVFHAAIAGAPVIDWRLYDTHYTERYLGLPEQNPATYEHNSLLGDAAALRRPLLLMHGLVDDNVFAAHSLRMSAALLAAGRGHDMLPLSGVTHMSPTDEEQAENFLLYQRDWLRDALGLKAPAQVRSAARSGSTCDTSADPG